MSSRSAADFFQPDQLDGNAFDRFPRIAAAEQMIRFREPALDQAIGALVVAATATSKAEGVVVVASGGGPVHLAREARFGGGACESNDGFPFDPIFRWAKHALAKRALTEKDAIRPNRHPRNGSAQDHGRDRVPGLVVGGYLSGIRNLGRHLWIGTNASESRTSPDKPGSSKL